MSSDKAYRALKERYCALELARSALQFAMFSNGTVTCEECRKAIKIIFGEEVDVALSIEFKQEKNGG